MTRTLSADTVPRARRRETHPDGDTAAFMASLVRELDRNEARRQLARAESEGRVRWTTERQRASQDAILDEAAIRKGLLDAVSAGPVHLNRRMMQLVRGLGHTLPVREARAAWAYDHRRGANAPPRLLINVELGDPVRLPNAVSVVSFSSNLPPGSNLDQLGPMNLEPDVLVAEEHGFNPHAAAYRIVPHVASHPGH